MSVRDIKERRARRQRVAHPVDDRLAPDLTGAPKAVRDEQRKVEKLVKRRQDLQGKLREANATSARAPAQDRAAKRAALADGKPFPKPTEATARAARDELREQYAAVKQAEADAFDRLAAVIADHAADWLSKRTEVVETKAAAAADALTQALEAWQELDAEYAVSTWIHQLDPDNRATHRLTRTSALSIGDTEGEQLIAGLIGLAKRAATSAQASTPGREHWQQTRAERQAKREQRAKQREQVAA